MAKQENQSLYSPLTLDGVRVPTNVLLFDGYLEVESVRAGPDTGQEGEYQGVEVRAATSPDAPHWRSLRYHTTPKRAPRARDMLRIIVLSCSTPPTAEQVQAAEQESEQ